MDLPDRTTPALAFATRWHWPLFIIALLVVAWAYAPSLAGAFVLDDTPNFTLLQRYLAGEVRWDGAVFGVASGPLHRPVAMATFLFDAIAQGFSPAALKRTNLVIHLLCGLAVFALARRVFARVLPAHAVVAALWLAVVWLLLPIHVSTVAYAVQRMTQLAALFSLLAAIAYLAARARLVANARGGSVLLWVVVPLLILIATLSKEAGALTPLMLLALEVYCRLTAAPDEPRAPRQVTVYFALAVVLPAIASLVALALKPSVFVGGYVDRTFTLAERLLTEPRILWDYVRQIVLPNTSRMGLVHDDFVVSRGLFSPWTTTLAIVAWLAVIALAFRFARRAPLVMLGVAWFIAGHLLESTVIPLELYFEHRNYLPSIGVLLALWGFALAIGEALAKRDASLAAPATLLLVLFPVLLVAATHGRARVWGDPDALYAQSLRQSPESLRLRSQVAATAMETGRTDVALEQIAIAERAAPARSLPAITLWRMLAWCEAGQPVPPALVEEFRGRIDVAIDITSSTATQLVADRVVDGRCQALSASSLAAVLHDWLVLPANAQRGGAHVGRVRYHYARLLAQDDALDEATREAAQAWRESGDYGMGVLVFQLQTALDDDSGARETLTRLDAAVPAWETQIRLALTEFRRYLDERAGAAATSG